MAFPQTSSDQTSQVREDWVDVEVTADIAAQTVTLHQKDGMKGSFLTQEAHLIARAIAATKGTAQWCAAYQRLLIPGALKTIGRTPFFKLGTATLPMPA